MIHADVREIFALLPQVDQAKFSSWVSRALDKESRWRRINGLVLALKLGPLQIGPRVDDTATGAAVPE
jgi:hypothetical protein